MGIGETETLIDLGVDPQLCTWPRTHAGKECGIPGLAALAAARETLGTFIRRSEPRIALPEERCLTVKVDIIHDPRRPGGGRRALRRRQWIAAELIVQANAHLLQRQIGRDRLRPAAEAVVCGRNR